MQLFFLNISMSLEYHFQILHVHERVKAEQRRGQSSVGFPTDQSHFIAHVFDEILLSHDRKSRRTADCLQTEFCKL